MNQHFSRRDFLKLAAASGTLLASGLPAWGQDMSELLVYWRNNPREIETMEQAFADFTADHPSYSVNFQQAAGGLEGDARLQALFAAGTPPEVFASVFNAGLVDYVYRDFVTDLTPLIERDAWDQSDYFDVALETFTFGGKQFGIPRGGIPSPLFYNKDLFDQAGLPYPPTDWEDESWTWDTMLEYAHALTKREGPRTTQYGIVIGSTLNWNQWPMLWGAQIFPDDAFNYGLTREHNFRDPVVVNSLQKMVDLIWTEEVAPTPEVSGGFGFFGPFNNGLAAMYIHLGAYTVANNAEFNWGAAALPRGEPSAQQRSTTFTGPFLIGSGSNVEGAWDLVKYLTGVDGQRTIMRGAVVGTSRQSLLEEWFGAMSPPTNELLAVQAGGYKHGLESPNVRLVGWGEIATLLSSEFDLMMLGERSAQEAVDALAPKLDVLLNEIYDKNIDKARTIFPDFPG